MLEKLLKNVYLKRSIFKILRVQPIEIHNLFKVKCFFFLRKNWCLFQFSHYSLCLSILEEMIVMPGQREEGDDVTLCDHPLSNNPDSEWQTFFKDNEVLLQIDKDVRRLCPDISFFQQPSEYPCSDIVNSNDVKRLHTRVQRKVLNCANVERKGLGITKVWKKVSLI